MTPDDRERLVDVAVGATLAVFPLLPTGFTYFGIDWPWALEVFYLMAAAAGLLVIAVHRTAQGSSVRAGSTESLRLVSRGYLTWLIPVSAAMIIGLLDRSPLDEAFLRVEADGLVGRLSGPMDQVVDPFYPLRVAITCFEGALMFWLLSTVLRRTSRPAERVRAALGGSLLGLAMVSVTAIVQYFTRVNLHEYWVRTNPGLTRSHATLDDPNTLASFLVLGIGLAIGVAWSIPREPANRWPQVRASLVAALACGALVTTVSRAGLAALVIAGIVIVALLPDRLIRNGSAGRLLRRVARGVVVLMTGALLLWAIAAATLPKRTSSKAPETPWEAVVQTIDPREPLDTVLKRRQLLWQAGLHLAAADWVLGAGLGEYPRFLASYPGSDGPENAHNYFIQVLAEVGVVGLLGLVLLLLAIALAVRLPIRTSGPRRARLACGVAMGLVAFVLTWLTGHPMLNLVNQLWLASVLAVALSAVGVIGEDANLHPAEPVRRPFAWFLHRAWVPAVAVVTLVAVAPRALASVDEGPPASYAAGVYAWEPGPPTDAPPGDARFRWTRRRAALREPVAGRVMTVPIYLARPDLPVTIQVTVDGVRMELVTLEKNGWHVLTYDLVAVAGEARWKSLRTVTLEFHVTPAFVPARAGNSEDRRELGVGLGAVRWSPPRSEWIRART